MDGPRLSTVLNVFVCITMAGVPLFASSVEAEIARAAITIFGASC